MYAVHGKHCHSVLQLSVTKYSFGVLIKIVRVFGLAYRSIPEVKRQRISDHQGTCCCRCFSESLHILYCVYLYITMVCM